ncbi:hypothetical protein F4777DRAFT_526064 [Nemania sp. FL0916]|nr:hypothetical protein F4777DRAFT_526064 [Nemania sp. FL0916]
MHLRSFIAGVGLAVATGAILLPPDFTIAGDTVKTLPVPTEIDTDAALSKVPDSLTLDLECPGCLRFRRKHGKEIPSHLKLDFRVESADGAADRFTLNGIELYPNPDPDSLHSLSAPVIPDMAGRRLGHPPRLRGGPNRPRGSQVLSFAMEMGEVATNNDEDLQLINLEIQIMGVGKAFIKDIPNIDAKLVKSPSGKLAIGTIGTTPSRTDAIDKQIDYCSTRLCRWKALFFDKLTRLLSLKGCGGSKAAHGPQGHQHGEHRHGHGHSAHQMGQKHSSVHTIAIIAIRILLPILIGIMAGISASIIGLVAGTLIVFVWRLLFRRGAQHSHMCRAAREAAELENAADEEKSGLLDGQEQVEAPPAYVESNVTVPEEKKPETEA